MVNLIHFTELKTASFRTACCF